ncbi:MAG TPA: hypothetical protein VGM64_18215 [Lacunisphaera sp.]|jgi:hypothetical protein
MRLALVSQKHFRLPALLTLAALIWIFATGHWTLASWQTPAAYSVDALEVLARFKLSGDAGFGILFNKVMPHLGAPWRADWSAYPMPDSMVFILFGTLAKITGLIAASNFALITAHLAAIATFYFCSRALGHRPVYSAAAALLFGFSFYNRHRGLSHYSFTLSYVVPAQLLSAWLIGSSQQFLKFRGWRTFCLATAVATGMGSPYFTFGFCQLLGFALIYQAATHRQRSNLMMGLACAAVLAATLLTTNYSAIFKLCGGEHGLLERNYASTEIYGLRPIELLIPPPSHRWAFAAGIGTRYAADTSLKGELFFPYLGIAGIGGLFVLAITATNAAIHRRLGLRPSYAALFGWLILFFIVGGLNGLLAFAGIDLFRAGNRYSIYLLAIALFALASWASRRSRHLPAWLASVFAIVATMIGLWDQLPRRPFSADRAYLAKKVSEDRLVAAQLDSKLPAGASVFQLPVVPFLEQPPVNGMTDYELFRPWFFSVSTNFSYGLLTGEKALRWEKWIAGRPVGEMCESLEKAGYAAIYLNKKAYPDAGAALRRQLIALGYNEIVEIGDHLAFALHPASSPKLPDVNADWLADPWTETANSPDKLQFLAEKGWFGLERNNSDVWRWAGREADLSIWNPASQSIVVSIEFSAATQNAGQITASFDEHQLWQIAAGQTPAGMVNLALTLQPGANHIHFHFTGPVTAPSATDRRLLGFRLVNLRLSQ